MDDTGELTAEHYKVKRRCIERAARILSEGYRTLYFAPLDDAARAAMSPGGPSFEEELRARIAQARMENLGTTAPNVG